MNRKTYLDRCFFEKTRLEIISNAACICADGALVYANKYFKVLARRAKIDKLTAGSVRSVPTDTKHCTAEICEVSFGRRNLKFAGTDITVYAETVRLYLDTKLCGRGFPIIYRGYMYFSLETLYGKIYIPFFGGELYADSYDKDSRRLLIQGERMKRIGSVAEIGVKYFCISELLAIFCEKLSGQLKNYGYLVQNYISQGSLAVCFASVYDISTALELLACCALKLSPGREGAFYVSCASESCSINFETLKHKPSQAARVSPEECFEVGSDERRVIESLMRFCNMYSWKLTCRESLGKLVFSLTLPKYNIEPSVFREKDDRDMIRSVNEAVKLVEMMF